MHTAIDGLTRSLHLVSRKTSLYIARQGIKTALRAVHTSTASMQSGAPSSAPSKVCAWCPLPPPHDPHKVKLALCQLPVGRDKDVNLCQAAAAIEVPCNASHMDRTLTVGPTGRRPARRAAGCAPRDVELPLSQRRLCRIRRAPRQGRAGGASRATHGRGAHRCAQRPHPLLSAYAPCLPLECHPPQRQRKWHDARLHNARTSLQAAKQHGVTLVGGSIPELHDGKLYNTCCVYGPDGTLLATHRKVCGWCVVDAKPLQPLVFYCFGAHRRACRSTCLTSTSPAR